MKLSAFTARNAVDDVGGYERLCHLTHCDDNEIHSFIFKIGTNIYSHADLNEQFFCV